MLTLVGFPKIWTSAAPDASPVIDSEAKIETSVPPLASISTVDAEDQPDPRRNHRSPAFDSFRLRRCR
jgi:hypothetical protein